MIGAELGYRYAGSPLIWPTSRARPEHDFMDYDADHLAGRAAAACLARRRHGDAGPHRQDGYTLLRLGRHARRHGGARARVRRAQRAVLRHGRCRTQRPRDIYGHDLLLLRPDLHVAWRGNSPPEDAEKLARRVTGN